MVALWICVAALVLLIRSVIISPLSLDAEWRSTTACWEATLGIEWRVATACWTFPEWLAVLALAAAAVHATSFSQLAECVSCVRSVTTKMRGSRGAHFALRYAALAALVVAAATLVRQRAHESALRAELAALQRAVALSLGPKSLTTTVAVTAAATALRQQKFELIFSGDSWNTDQKRDEDDMSVSGPGSSLGETLKVRTFLGKMILKHSIKLFLDVPCGAFSWQAHIPHLDHVKYLGLDIVRPMIAKLQHKYRNSPNLQFGVADMITMDFNLIMDLDVVMMRDVLFHMPSDAALKAIANVERSGAKYLISTSFISTTVNRAAKNMKHGWWYPINLEIAPFFFPRPDDFVMEANYSEFGERIVGMWKLPIIRHTGARLAELERVDTLHDDRIRHLRMRLDALELGTYTYKSNKREEGTGTSSTLADRHQRRLRGGPSSTSPGGSNYIEFMKVQLDAIQASSVLDVGCGESMSALSIDATSAAVGLWARGFRSYNAIDYDPLVVAKVKAALLHRSTHSPAFAAQLLDVVTTPIRRSYDVVIMRRLLGSMLPNEAIEAIRNVQRSKSRYLIATFYERDLASVKAMEMKMKRKVRHTNFIISFGISKDDHTHSLTTIPTVFS